MSHPLDRSATQLAADLAARRIGALELTDAAIARIEDRDRDLNAVVVRDFGRALEAARAADAAIATGDTGPLLGVPMTVKESNNVARLKTTWGAPVLGDFTARTDAVAVSRLKAAGAIILGKTNVPPFLADWQSNNPIYGRTRNPWNLDRSPGGSSGGAAAALAAGMTPLELGSDIGGSIRVPAAFCGVFGHKPTFDLVPMRGHAPPGIDGVGVLLGVVGPLARTAEDLDLALGVLAGPDVPASRALRFDPPPPRGRTLADFRVLVLDHHPIAVTDSQIQAAVSDLAVRLEAEGVKVARASPLLPDFVHVHQLYGGMMDAIMTRGAPNASQVSAHAWFDMLDGQLAVQRQWAALFEAFDVVVAPTFGVTAYPHDDSDMSGRAHVIDGVETAYFGQLGWPALATFGNLPATAAPISLSREGLPIGVQIIGPAFEDRTTIHFARLMERAFGGFQFPPGYN